MTSYLTRVVVPKADILRFRIGDRYAWHKEIWKAFPATPQGTSDLFQWRIDRKEAATILWILSRVRPERQNWGRWDTNEVADSFLRRRRYFFSLCANPTVMTVVRKDDGSRKKNGRRVAIYREDELKQWLQRKGEDSGFELEQIRVTPPIKEYFSKGYGKDRGVHSCVEFVGVLKVVDWDKFSATYQTGIGSAKGFGFGLLLLKPVE